ncbi:MAG: protein kinase, partial [Planctomycetaceae bacterium]|nr:protein kinase [Planctomycetaceae bacterium]
DIKPANLILAEQEFGPPIVKVLDLGLALLAESPRADEGGLTSDGQIMGTIDYMPPEQAQDSHTVDARADIYSLGATLYALLTGGSVFQGRPHTTLMQKLLALATEPIPLIRERRPDLSESLAAIVHRMIARDPKDRFASPAEVVATLKPFAVGADLSALIAGDSDHTILEATDVVELAKVKEKLSHEASTKALEVVQPTVVNPAASRQKRLPVAIATAVAGVVLLGAILFSLKTPNGEVVVDVDGLSAEELKQIEIKVSGNGEMKVANEANGWTIGVKEGKYDVQLTGGKDRVQIDKNDVTVSRNNKPIVKVTLKPSGSTALSNGTNPSGGTSTDPDRKFAEWLRSYDPQLTFGGNFSDNLPFAVEPGQPIPNKPFRLNYINLVGKKVDEQGDAYLEELANHLQGVRLRGLMFATHSLASRGMARFLRLPEIADCTSIAVNNTGVEDDVLEAISKLTKLTGLSFQTGPKLTGKGIGQLRELTELTGLTMLGCPGLSAEAMEQLQTLTKLEALHMHGPRFADRHISALAKFKLKQLLTDEAGIDDAMVARFAEMQTLESLALTRSPITDAGLPELKKLKGLMVLHLFGTKVTAAGV